MKKKLTAQVQANQQAKKARAALKSHNLAPAVDTRFLRDSDGVETWEAYTTQRVMLPNRPVDGNWYVEMYWLVWSDPAGGSASVVESSISLNVVDSSLTNALSKKCLVRYDVDNRADAPTMQFSPAHLNVLQPGKLDSHIHYPVIGLDSHDWDVKNVLGFFLSDRLWQDLADRLN